MRLSLLGLLFFFADTAFSQNPYPLDSVPTGTGLTAYYWSLPPKGIPTTGEPQHREGWADENLYNTSNSGEFVATIFDYSGDDLTPIKGWLGRDSDSFVGEEGILGDAGFRMVGYVRIETPGEQTFTTTSDDGSVVYVNDQLVVDNDNGHGNTTVTGSLEFEEPGYYPIDIRYFNGDWTNDAGSHGGANFIGEEGFDKLVPGLEGVQPFYTPPVPVETSVPLAHYTMDEPSGESQMRDVTGRGNNGVYANVTLGQEALATGTSAAFADGAQGTISQMPLRNFTLSLWLNAAELTGLQTLVGQGSNTPIFALILNDTNLAWFVGDTIDFETDNAPIRPGETFHVAVTYTSRGGTPETVLYVNGTEAARKNPAATVEPNSFDPITIGAFSGNLSFNGRLDDVQIYNRVLSADAIKGLHDDPGSVSGEILMGELPAGAIAGDRALGGTPGLAGYYWSLDPKEVPTSGEPMHRTGDGPDGVEGANAGWADEHAFATASTGSFVATTYDYGGNDLTPIETWLGADSASYSGESGLLGDGVFRMVGYLYVDLPGERSFTTTTDDGSVVYINDALVVSNDNGHGNQEALGKVDFPATGFYSIDVRYFNGDWTNDAGDHGGANFLGQAGFEVDNFFVSVEGVDPFYVPPGGVVPGGDNEPGGGGGGEDVPNDAIPGGPELAGEPGLAGFYWSLDPKAVPTNGEPMHRPSDGPNGVPGATSGWADDNVFNTRVSGTFAATTLDYAGDDLTPIRDWLGVDSDSFSGEEGQLGDAVFRMAGYLYVETPGERTLTTTTDDGSVVYVNDQLVVSNDNGHGPETVSGTIAFPTAGYYPVDVRYFNGDWTNDAGAHGGATFLAEAGFEDIVATVQGVEPFYEHNAAANPDKRAPGIRQIVRTLEGIALQLPEGKVFDIEYSNDLINWEPIASEVADVYSDPDPTRTEESAGYYRAVASAP